MLVGDMRVCSNSDRQGTDLQRDALQLEALMHATFSRIMSSAPKMIDLAWPRRWNSCVPETCSSSGRSMSARSLAVASARHREQAEGQAGDISFSYREHG